MESIGAIGNGNVMVDRVTPSSTPVELTALEKGKEGSMLPPLESIAIDKNGMAELVNKMNEMLDPMLTSLRFKVHEDTSRYYVELVDTVKNEVLKEIPAKKLLDYHAAMDRFIGLLFDKKA